MYSSPLTRSLRTLVALALLLGSLSTASSQELRIASYNVENYLHEPRGTRPAKPEDSRIKICQAVRTLNPDILALQEIGGETALTDLRRRLETSGLRFPYSEIVTGYDTNIFVALISRYPFAARRSHPDERFLLRGRRYHTTRGILEVEIALTSGYRFTLMAAHLKSRRESGSAPQEEIRLEEALILRRLINTRLRANPEENLVVLGDLNDTKDSLPLRTILGRGSTALIDTRPAERNGDNLPPSRRGTSPRNIAWTHFYGRQDTYSRIDYILVSPGMAREWQPEESFVLAFPNWGQASDHRPLLITVSTRDR